MSKLPEPIQPPKLEDKLQELGLTQKNSTTSNKNSSKEFQSNQRESNQNYNHLDNEGKKLSASSNLHSKDT